MNTTNPLSIAWGFPTQTAVCERCDALYVLPAAPAETPRVDAGFTRPPASAGRCPRCFQAELEAATSAPAGEPPDPGAASGSTPADSSFTYTQPPELAVPFTISQAQIDTAVQRFAQGIPYPPPGLTPAALRRGLRPVYLPMWLVDAEVQANWKAEAGFDYQVVSHQERYADGGGWATRQVKENRIRWEPRLGRLQRTYHNHPAPALEEHPRLKAFLGEYNLAAARPYSPHALAGAIVRLPDRSPLDAWSDARPGLQSVAGEECRQAAQAGHLRSFTWQPTFCSQNWTLLLLPAYTAAYLDDDHQPQVVWINGQTGQINGARRASMQQATRASLGILGAAGVIFLLSILALMFTVVLPPLAALGVVGMTLALVVALGAIVPVFRARNFNRQ